MNSKNGIVNQRNSDKDFTIIDVSTSLYKAYFDQETKKRLEELSKKVDIYLVTGARESTLRKRLHALTFIKGAILENGGLILDENLQKDESWAKSLESESKILKFFIARLEEKGFVLDNQGRYNMARIREDDNAFFKDKDFEEFYESLKIPKGLKKSRNFGHIDIIPTSSGKGPAVKYLISKIKAQNTYGIGDDINDIDMLKITDHSFLLGSSFPEAIKEAKKENMYISKGFFFEGINEILDKISESCI
ncbi:HAD hydrolase family protein [Candidatus Gracilibacteria bacterium]|nr:HAD hydrolase family protein [Candidatus Gracilibacteria bacterium]